MRYAVEEKREGGRIGAFMEGVHKMKRRQLLRLRIEKGK